MLFDTAIAVDEIVEDPAAVVAAFRVAIEERDVPTATVITAVAWRNDSKVTEIWDTIRRLAHAANKQLSLAAVGAARRLSAASNDRILLAIVAILDLCDANRVSPIRVDDDEISAGEDAASAAAHAARPTMATPSYIADKHTREGKRAKRGDRHFWEEATVLSRPWIGEEDSDIRRAYNAWYYLRITAPAAA